MAIMFYGFYTTLQIIRTNKWQENNKLWNINFENLIFLVDPWILQCIFSKKKLKKLEISQHRHLLRCERSNYAFVYLHMCNIKSQTLALNKFKGLRFWIEGLKDWNRLSQKAWKYEFGGAARYFIPWLQYSCLSFSTMIKSNGGNSLTHFF